MECCLSYYVIGSAFRDKVHGTRLQYGRWQKRNASLSRISGKRHRLIKVTEFKLGYRVKEGSSSGAKDPPN
jgi:hypothetical protein